MAESHGLPPGRPALESRPKALASSLVIVVLPEEFSCEAEIQRGIIARRGTHVHALPSLLASSARVCFFGLL